MPKDYIHKKEKRTNNPPANMKQKIKVETAVYDAKSAHAEIDTPPPTNPACKRFHHCNGKVNMKPTKC